MNKLLATAAIIGTSVFTGATSASNLFIGGQLGKATVDYDSRWLSGNKYSGDDKNTDYGIRLGQEHRDYRIYGSITHNDGPRRSDTTQFLASADLLLTQGPLRPFVGASAGVTHLDYRGSTDNAFTYGVQAGVLYQLNHAWSIEAGLQRLKHDNSVHYWGEKFETDRTDKAFLAANFKF